MGRTFIIGDMTLRPDSRGLHTARGQVRNVLRELNLSEDDRDHLLIAVGEAISNAYLHGTPDRHIDHIHVAWEWDDDRVTIAVKDSGKGFGSELHFRLTDYRGSLARGVELMRQGADEVEFTYDRGAEVILVKRLSDTSRG